MITPLRLGYLISQYPTVNHTFILREIRSLRQAGFDIRVVAVRPTDRPVSALGPDEVDEHRQTYAVLEGGAGRVLGALLRMLLQRPVRWFATLGYALRLAGPDLERLPRYLAYFAEAVAAGEYFEKNAVEHIHSHFSSTVEVILSRFVDIPYSVTIHGPEEFDDVVGFQMAEKVARARFITTISDYAASQTMRASDPRHWSKIHTVPLGVDPQAFTPAPRREPDGLFRILSVGRLAPAKAFHVLIAAVGRLVAEGRHPVRLTIVGEGVSRPSLEQAIREQGLDEYVTLAGSCNPDRIAEYYRQADVFAMASFAEGVPVVLMEAMAMEVPCVATCIAGIPELIRPEVDGLLVPPANPEALAGAIARLMDDPELRARFGPCGRTRVLDRYHLARNTEKLAQVFQRYRTSPGISGVGDQRNETLG